MNKTLSNKAKPLGKYPHLKRVGEFVYISGTSSRRPDNSHVGAEQRPDGSWELDVAKQTAAVIDNILEILSSVEADLSHIVDITTFLVDMKDFPEYNRVYGQYFDFENGPTRTTVAVHQLPHPNLLIEMKAIAYMPQNR